MQVLNFVPRDYIRKKLVRKANLLCAVLATAVGVALTGLFVVLGVAEDTLSKEQRAVEGDVAQATGQVAMWRQFQADRKVLLERADKAARLLIPLPRSRIVAEVIQSLPTQTSLTDLSIAQETVRTVTSAAQDLKAAGRRQKATEISEESQMRLRLRGLAPTDVEVAQLIAGLANSQCFDQVDLSFSEDQLIENHVLRRFEVSFSLSKDAYRLSLAVAGKEEQQ